MLKLNAGEAALVTRLKQLTPQIPLPRCQEHAQGQWCVREDPSMAGESAYRFDAAWPEQKVLVEIDGHNHKHINMRVRDSQKRNLVQLHGYIVLCFTLEQLEDDPSYACDTIRDALTTRSLLKSGKSVPDLMYAAFCGAIQTMGGRLDKIETFGLFADWRADYYRECDRIEAERLRASGNFRAMVDVERNR